MSHEGSPPQGPSRATAGQITGPVVCQEVRPPLGRFAGAAAGIVP